MKLDNIAPIPRNDPIGKAALRFMESVERGTAFSPVVLELDGIAIPNQLGDKVVYRAMAGDCYPATITAVRSPDLVDLDVIVPGCEKPVHLTKIKFSKEGA